MFQEENKNESLTYKLREKDEECRAAVEDVENLQAKLTRKNEEYCCQQIKINELEAKKREMQADLDRLTTSTEYDHENISVMKDEIEKLQNEKREVLKELQNTHFTSASREQAVENKFRELCCQMTDMKLEVSV